MAQRSTIKNFQKRELRVYRFLIKNGVDKSRLKAYGVGESQNQDNK